MKNEEKIIGIGVYCVEKKLQICEKKTCKNTYLLIYILVQTAWYKKKWVLNYTTYFYIFFNAFFLLLVWSNAPIWRYVLLTRFKLGNIPLLFYTEMKFFYEFHTIIQRDWWKTWRSEEEVLPINHHLCLIHVFRCELESFGQSFHYEEDRRKKN